MSGSAGTTIDIIYTKTVKNVFVWEFYVYLRLTVGVEMWLVYVPVPQWVTFRQTEPGVRVVL